MNIKATVKADPDKVSVKDGVISVKAGASFELTLEIELVEGRGGE